MNLVPLMILNTPAFVLGAVPADVSVYHFSAGRLGALGAGGLALAGVIVGCLALARQRGRFGAGQGRRGAIVAVVAGLLGLILGAVVAATAKGGVGTGNGLGGAFVAMAAGLGAVVIGGLALARSHSAR